LARVLDLACSYRESEILLEDIQLWSVTEIFRLTFPSLLCHRSSSSREFVWKMKATTT